MPNTQRDYTNAVASFMIGVGVSQCSFQAFLILAYPFVEVGPLKDLIALLPIMMIISLIGGLFALLCYFLKSQGLYKTSSEGAILLLGCIALILAIGQCIIWPRGRNDFHIFLFTSVGLLVGLLLTVVRYYIRYRK